MLGLAIEKENDVLKYKWTPTTREVYHAIYSQHSEALHCFESYTENDDDFKLRAQVTGWGFDNAQHPIIRSEMRDYGEWEYFILMTAYGDEDDA